MLFTAKSLYIRYSPYKLRPLADVVRGKPVQSSLHWLDVCALKKAIYIRKVIASAAANAKDRSGTEAKDLVIKEIRVDEGARNRYFKPGAMGRSNPYKRRLSHVSVVLESAEKQEVHGGSKG